MELKLKHEKNTALTCVLENALTQEETMEMIVPDSKPDIFRVISSDAKVMISGKDADIGRVAVRGNAEIDVLCLADDETTPVPLHLSVPFLSTATGSELSGDTKIIADCSTSACEISLLNPRKILAKVEILVMLRCYRENEFEYVSFCLSL